MSEEQEDYVADEVDYDCTQEPDAFARKIGLSTQRIQEINREIVEEEEKENNVPGIIEKLIKVTVVAPMAVWMLVCC